MYTIDFTIKFVRDYKKFTGKNKSLKDLIDKKLLSLINDPFTSEFKTHKVKTHLYNYSYSSRISGDIRILWNIDQNNKLNIIALSLGGHTGQNKVYK